jgi:hypothetical protein
MHKRRLLRREEAEPSGSLLTGELLTCEADGKRVGGAAQGSTLALAPGGAWGGRPADLRTVASLAGLEAGAIFVRGQAEALP